MRENQNRLTLSVDVFAEREQPADVLASITPTELIEAILQEFDELDYLGDDPARYYLHKAVDPSPLEASTPLGEQLRDRDRVVLADVERPLPAGAQRPPAVLYLREQSSGAVYKLDWLPAIIGRFDESQPHNEWLAVDLEPYPTGLRVSRRQAMLTAENGQLFIERLSSNATTITEQTGQVIALDGAKHPLHDGDLIRFNRSDITLKLIVRQDEMPSVE